MRIAGIIPARYASTRFPGKPLADIDGKSMIRRVFEQASSCKLLSDVAVATDDERIAAEVISFGGKYVMTSVTHTTGTERCHEAASFLDTAPDIIINIQGDEPYIDPRQIEQVAELFLKGDVMIATLKKKIRTSAEIFDPNVVKVVTSREGYALYFSRNPVPFVRSAAADNWLSEGEFFRHVGIYGYRRDILEKLIALPHSPPEKAESLEQLRWLWHGYQVRVGETDYESIAVDVPSDLLKFTNRK